MRPVVALDQADAVADLLLDDVILVAQAVGWSVMGRILLPCGNAGFQYIYIRRYHTNRAVAKEGQAENNKVFCGIRSIDSLAHNYLQSKKEGRRQNAVALVGQLLPSGSAGLS